jgi:heat shock protein 1/8
VNDEKFQGKISEEDKRIILNKISDIEGWLSSNQEAGTSDFENKQKELENIYNPIMQKAYQGGYQEGNCRQ